MVTIYLDDRRIIKECGDELEHVILADGLDYGISYLRYLLNAYRKSRGLLEGISQTKSVRRLLSRVSPEQAREIKELLKGESDDNRTGEGSGN